LRPAVCVYDPSASRRAELSHLISECGAEPRIYPGDGLDTEAVSSSLGLVSIEPDFAALTLRAVRNLKKRDFDVLVVHVGPEPMSLADRCQALLAGASAVLDIRASDFVPATRRWIADKIKGQILRAEETADLRRTMREMSIIGESAALVAAFSRLVKVSKLSDVPVLIQGESGTGKGLFAQALQRLDPKRSRAPFVSVNCAAISAQLIESELFGHRKGSFTGAERHRKGLIRSAEGGTLFLDEVGELDIAVQAKMLRVLQEKRVLGVGEDQEVTVDIRVVAATNRSLEEMVRERTFRADLYHRLNVVSISIPPLYGRPEDIAPLVQHFLSKHADIAFDRNFEISR
jgi:transcriptional regulator with GAF, ATPase, and Fis domain